ncbi:MAG: MerR family transcriptional regulator [Peptostreptococcaceae bacterium]|nr:MerR family transcriptional regulator [Peptostreptococcaceae bacterium]
MNYSDDYFRTGEFAEIVGVSKQTLIHYDKIGLFSPEITDSNKYRYYSHNQLETFPVISMLKELGVPLEQIKSTITHGSPTVLLDLLNTKKSQIDERIRRLNWCKKFIDEKIHLTEEGNCIEPDTFYIKRFPEEYMIRVETPIGVSPSGKYVSASIVKLFNYCKKLGVNSSFSVGAIIPLSQLKKTSYSFSHLYTIVEKTDEIKDLAYDSSGNYLVYYSNKGYTKVLENCHKLLEYGNARDMNLGNCIYEDNILDDLSGRSPNSYMIRLAIEIIGGK